MKRSLTYGMVGGDMSAFIGKVHRTAIRLNDNATLVAGCFSLNPEKQSATASACGIDSSRSYGSYEEMAEKEGSRKDKIDFVSIVTPNHLHYPVAKLFLEKGIHVVCEKPLCFTVKEGLELKRIAKENDCLFGVTYTYIGHVMTREAREIIKSGQIGNVLSVIGEYPQDGKLRFFMANKGKDPSGWRFDPKRAGRGATVADIGTHIESFVTYVTDLKIKSLCCTLTRPSETPDLDSSATCLIKYDNGANGMYWASQVAAGYDNGFKIRILGDLGTLEFIEEESNYLKLRRLDEPVKIYSRGKPYMSSDALDRIRLPSGHSEGLTEAFANIYRDFCRAIFDKQDGKQVVEEDYGYPTIDMGIKGVEFFNKCVDSDSQGSIWVDVNY